MDITRSIFLSARSFFLGTAFSRITGLFRDIAIAMSFGASVEIAAFMVAYRLANLFRRLFGEGNLSAAFVPHFIGLKEKGPYFFRDFTYSMGLILLGAIIFLEALFFAVKDFVPPSWQEIIDLTIWMVPGLFFICLYGLNSALLQCQKKFFMPAVAPAIFNLVWIAICFTYPNVYVLSFAVTVACFGQWLVTSGEGFSLLPLKEWLKPKLFSVDCRALFKPLFLGIIGLSAVQFNSALDALFARSSELKGPAFLWYAIRVQQLPLALFGIALSSALLPPLSKEPDPKRKKELLQSILKQAAAIMLICTFGMIALAESGVSLLFRHGDFGSQDVINTANCLIGYAVGLVPSVFILIFAAYYYANKDYKTPMRASLLSVGINIALNALFVFFFQFGALSVAIATSLSAFVNCIYLGRKSTEKSLWPFCLKFLLGSSIACIFVKFFSPFLTGYLPIIEFSLLFLLYLGLVSFFTWRFGLSEIVYSWVGSFR